MGWFDALMVFFVAPNIGFLYWLVAIVALVLAMAVPRSGRGKAFAGLAVVCLVAYLPTGEFLEDRKARQRLDEAMTHFQERCKSAGEKIHRTVENVDGVVWMKWREESPNFGDQFRLDDPYGHDCGGAYCIERLLRVTAGAEFHPEEAKRHRTGYRFVETTDPKDGKKYRYVGVIGVAHIRTPDQIEQYKRNSGGVDPGPNDYRFKLERQAIDAFTARYGITWDDISTRDDRERWVAGGSLKVTDLKTNEVIAERVGFMVDRGQGSKAGARSPWLFAVNNACPEFPQVGEFDPRRNRDSVNTNMRQFAIKVLTPTTGD